MLIVLQFPICDVRRFVEGENGCLPRPNWWLADAGKDFVRSIGMIRKRRMGGLDNWIGEYKICIAANALRFDKTPEAAAFFHQPGWKIAFRTFFFDGCCVGKFEIGVSTAPDADLPKVKDALRQFMNLPVRVPTGVDGTFVTCKLGDAGKPLAALFAHVSTDQKWPAKASAPAWWVSAHTPVLLIEQRAQETVPVDLRCDRSFPPRAGVPAIDHHLVTRQGRELGAWAYREDASLRGRQEVRRLRIALLRIHAEREVLVNVLRLAADGRLNVAPAGDANGCGDGPVTGAGLDDPSAQRNCSDLQAYLNAATRRIGKLEQRMGVPVAALANELDDAVNAGEREAILAAIDGIRGNVRRKVQGMMERPLPPDAAPDARLTGGQIGLLRDALLAAFDRAGLVQVVRIHLDEDLEDIVKDDALKNMVFDLVCWAERMGRTDALIAGACAENPGHVQLHEVAETLRRKDTTGDQVSG